MASVSEMQTLLSFLAASYAWHRCDLLLLTYGVVCVYVCLYVFVCITVSYPAKTAGPIEMAFGVWGGVGPSNHVLDGSPDLPRGRGNLGDFFPTE